jgi:chromatin remodeling complex protein RSC6
MAKKKASSKRKSSIATIKYELSEELAEFMNKDTATRPDVVKALWKHIKAEGLLKPGRKIVPDEILASITGKSSFGMMELMGKLTGHFGDRV